MTKKTIVLVLIAVILFNTIYWLYITIRVFGFSVSMSDNARLAELKGEKEKLPGEWRKAEIEKKPLGFRYFVVDIDKLSKEEYEKYEKIKEEIKIIQERIQRRERNFTSRLVRVFQIKGRETIPIIILTITDAILVAISFMIILLYKKD